MASNASGEDRFQPWSPACNEYLEAFASGRFDDAAQLWFILPLAESSLDHGRGAFVVGAAGCDGIEFCFRRGRSGVWAYYPIDGRWELKASTLEDLERGWLDGTIAV